LLFKAKGDFEQAAEFCMKCLEIRNAVLPSNHPDLATSYNNLGELQQAIGDFEQADKFYMICLEIRKAITLNLQKPTTT
jgi:tetratricopeptide (TPR) repeat protein